MATTWSSRRVEMGIYVVNKLKRLISAFKENFDAPSDQPDGKESAAKKYSAN